jgi:uncharacterized spore protein YtfJ
MMSDQTSASAVERGVNEFFATFERAQQSATIEAVYGKPVTYGDRVILPIARATQIFGLGMGVGDSANTEGKHNTGLGGGGGGSAGARPIALAEITAEGVEIHPIVDENRALTVSLVFAAWAVLWTARTLIKIFQGALTRSDS